MTTPVDDLPIEIRRKNWGWFGAPWPSGICYDDDGRLRAEMRKRFPVDETCLHCGEKFEVGDRGQAMPFADKRASGVAHYEIRHVHIECLLRATLGSVSCMKGEHNHATGQTYRQEALEVWEWTRTQPR